MKETCYDPTLTKLILCFLCLSSYPSSHAGALSWKAWLPDERVHKASLSLQGLPSQKSQITHVKTHSQLQHTHDGETDSRQHGEAKAAAVLHTVTAELDNFKVDCCLIPSR